MDVDTSGLCSNGIYFSLAFLMLFFPTPASLLQSTMHDFTVYNSLCECGQNISVLT